MHSGRLPLPLLVLLLALPLAAATPAVSNRTPNPDEVGYRPAHGSTVRLNPPSFIWLHDKEATTYGIQWARQDDFSKAEGTDGLPWNTYTHAAPLEAGTYYWRYRFATQDGATSTWSIARRVVVPPNATAFPMPTPAEQAERIPIGHPRLFLRPDDLPRLRMLAQAQEAQRFQRLKAEADRILQAGPTPEPEHLGSARDKDNAELVQYWWPNRTQTERACQEAETLAFVYLLTNDPHYGEAARRWVLHLASWDPDGPTNFRLNCEAAKPLLFRPARAYDWAWDRFSETERVRIRNITARRIQDAWESGEVGRGTGHLNRPFNSHGNRVWHKIGEAGIAFLGEIPQAATWLDYALNKFYACYPIWADDDGGWHEGVSYWSGYQGKAVWWLQVAQSALGIDGLKKPFFAQIGDYPLYVAPPHSPNAGFGDLSFRPPSPSAGAFMEYHLRMRGSQPDGQSAGVWRWWTEQWNMPGQSGILGFLYAANLPPLPTPSPPTNLPPSKVFRGIGVASLHTTLLDARDDVHFLFKSSPFGTQSHGHNPHNTFQLNAYGDALLTTCGYRDLHGSRFHYDYVHSTKAHNGVLVNNQGQIKHSPAPHGRILDAQLNLDWDYVVGDATDAYGGRLARYRRHVAFVKNPTPFIVLYDDLQAKEPATYQFMLHALSEFAVDPVAHSLRLQGPNAGLLVQYLSPSPLAFRQWDGFDPPPSRDFPNQWHVEASTDTPQRDLHQLTIIVPHRHGQSPTLTATRLESDSALGALVTLNDRSSIVAFRKPGTTGPASLENHSWTGPFLLAPQVTPPNPLPLP